jgi:hypothetical protein
MLRVTSQPELALKSPFMAAVMEAAGAKVAAGAMGQLPIALIGLQVPDFTTRDTMHGPQLFREFDFPVGWEDRIWSSWQRDKLKWLEVGAYVKKIGSRFLVIQWLNPDGSLPPIARQRMEQAFGTAPEVPVPKMKGKPGSGGGFALEPEHVTEYVDPDTYEPTAQLEPIIAEKISGRFEYQQRPARQLMDSLNRWGGAIDASDMGTGKTFQTLAAAACTFKNIGIVCPLSVRSAWLKAFRHFGLDHLFIENYEALRGGSRRWYRQATGWNVVPKDTIIIFDEAHRCKNGKTANSRLLRWAIDQGIWAICASGTIATAPWELEITGRLVKLHNGGDSYDQFLMRNGCYWDSAKKKWKLNRGGHHMSNLNRQLFPLRGARVRIEDLGDLFPETQILAEPYTVGDAARRTIDEAFENAERKIRKLRREQGDGAANRARGGAFMEAWHESEMAKVEAAVELGHNELEAGRSIMFFCNFNDVREAIMKAFNTRCGIYGGQHPGERDRCISAYQSNRERVIVCNLTAGGVGVSLHDEHGGHPRSSIIFPNPRAADFKQAFGRPHRAGGKSKSRQIVFFAAETVEESICDNIREKLANLDSLNDGELNPTFSF